MRFWDTSALIPLLVAERSTVRVEQWLKDDPDVVVWTLTRVELVSALARRRREDPSAATRRATAPRELLSAWPRWSEVTAVDVVRRHAERLVETHPIRAADALQIGAALVAAAGDPDTLEVVTSDRRIAETAEREGFPSWAWPEPAASSSGPDGPGRPGPSGATLREHGTDTRRHTAKPRGSASPASRPSSSDIGPKSAD